MPALPVASGMSSLLAVVQTLAAPRLPVWVVSPAGGEAVRRVLRYRSPASMWWQPAFSARGRSVGLVLR